MNTDSAQEEMGELLGLVRVLGTYEAQVAAEHYLLGLFVYTEWMN